ncbi:MAG: hypothetical protein AAF512_15635 [Pseudomonadota bacterium]
MTWIKGVAGVTELESLIGNHSAILERYRAFYLGLWRDELVPRRVLELCRLRIAFIHNAAAEVSLKDPEAHVSEDEIEALRLGHFGQFTNEEQYALQLAEQMPHAHHQITDEEVQHVSAAFGNNGCVGLLTALAFFDVTCRLKLVWDISPTENIIDFESLQ